MKLKNQPEMVSSSNTDAEETLVEAALRVLNTADPFEKARLGDEVANKWLQGLIHHPYNDLADLPVPDRPARFEDVSNRIHPFVPPTV